MTIEAEITNFITNLKKINTKFDDKLVKKAAKYAVKYHGSQQRASGDPYFYHPFEVAHIIASMSLDTASIVTAILHDTIEDTDLTYDDISKNFSPEIAKLVDGVTKLAKIKFQKQNVRQAENFRKLLLAMSDDIRVLLVKLADRLHNMRTIKFIASEEKRTRIALETIEIYAPLAERIGAQQIKYELQDLSFEILHPEVRKSILSKFAAIALNKDHMVFKIINEIKSLLEGSGISAKVSGRKKTAYSTWMKMKQKNVGLEQLSDIIAFRVIVKTIEECYMVLGYIHKQYKMVPGNFQDFISTPKPNGYQSLHTVVIGPFQEKIEVQIRTSQMHEIAEYGVAAHWQYKHAYQDQAKGKQYRWVRELLSILEQTSDPEDFIINSKMAMYYDQVFCFTDNGNLIALPKGATVIDFAYNINPEIGSKCSGAKVNGRLVPPHHILENGDQVNINIAQHFCVNTSWEKHVITGKARAEIRKFLQSQQSSQYINLGKNIITKALEEYSQEDIDINIAKAASVFNKTEEELFRSIGEGHIRREEILEIIKPSKARLSPRSLFNFSFYKKGKNKKTKIAALPIKGLIPGMVVHYAPCCHPIPPDKIVGIIHSGSGIIIHTNDCDCLKNFMQMPERIIDVTWDNNLDENDPIVSKLKLRITNKTSSLAVITNDIAHEGGNIINFKIDARNQDYFDLSMDIETESIPQINNIVTLLRTKTVVMHVEKVKD